MAPETSVIVRQITAEKFEVYSEADELIGTSTNEIRAIWGAFQVADGLSQKGQIVRIYIERNGRRTEEYVTHPPKVGAAKS